MKTDELILALLQDHHDLADQLVAQKLRTMIGFIEADLKSIRKGFKVNIYSLDPDEDTRILQEKLAAFHAVLEYYVPLHQSKGGQI